MNQRGSQKSRSFDSAEVRFAQDDRSIFDRNIEDKALDADNSAEFLYGFGTLFESGVFFRS
jgi:hypothetical protein